MATSSSTVSRGPALALFLFTLGCLAAVADANAFLRRVQQQGGTATLSSESGHALLAELEVALGGGHRHATERRLKRLEQMLRPMFGAMTKNANGKLDSAAAGYMLHRIFVQRHGWQIRALEPAGNSHGAWNSSSPTSVLEERVPEHVENLFQKRLGEHGMDLKELAILASSLEHLVHVEALERLNVSYAAKGYSQEDELSKEEAMNVLETYMSIYILGLEHSNLTTMTFSTGDNMHANMVEYYPEWPSTQAFLQEVYQSVSPKRDYVYFNEVENVIAEIGERYGQFQNSECQQFKNWLVEVEDTSIGGAGRVRLSDFYARALHHGKWQFSESRNYLRQLGALDESDASNPRVIIPNYVNSPSNCLASSAYYSVCCMDECEGILGRLEETISAPEASASTILNQISTISSATVPSNRTLSPWLHQRLDEVAQHHGGLIPLHGRLFAQWLHYAYPRECSFPHISGTIDPLRPADLEARNATQEEVIANDDEMRGTIAAAPPRKNRSPEFAADASEESGMWSMEEELVVWRPQNQPPQQSTWRRFFAPVAMVGAVVSASIAVVQSVAPSLKQLQKLDDKYYV